MILQDNLTSLDPTMTVGATLREAVRYNRDWDHARSEREIGAMLDRLLLERTVLQKRPIQLSGGQRQRVNIARALLVDPEVLICDEITSSLDVLTQYRLLELLRQLNRETGLPMLFISHDIQGVKRVSDRVLVMHRGQITEELHRADGFACSGTAARRLFAALPHRPPRKTPGAGPALRGAAVLRQNACGMSRGAVEESKTRRPRHSVTGRVGGLLSRVLLRIEKAGKELLDIVLKSW